MFSLLAKEPVAKSGYSSFLLVLLLEMASVSRTPLLGLIKKQLPSNL
jgi:hypothetical protein